MNQLTSRKLDKVECFMILWFTLNQRQISKFFAINPFG